MKELVLLFAGKYRPELVKQIDDRKKILDRFLLAELCLLGGPGKSASALPDQTKEYLIEFDNRSGITIHSRGVTSTAISDAT